MIRPTSADLVSSRIAMSASQNWWSFGVSPSGHPAEVPPGNKGIAFVSFKDPNNAWMPNSFNKKKMVSSKNRSSPIFWLNLWCFVSFMFCLLVVSKA